MARYRGPVGRLCRREGVHLYLSNKCYTKKCPLERRGTPPGQHGVRRRKMSNYGLQLREKQRVRRMYMVNERPFKRLYETAASRPGVTGENLLRLLETRLDNVVYRMGFANSRPLARQLVAHGHLEVNGVRTNIPSFRVREGDKIEVRAKSRKTEYFKQLKDAIGGAPKPEWVDVDADKLVGTVTAMPTRDQMPLEVNEQLVVEYYSR
jgi:small subunit ribosomal protein S4